MRDASPVVAHVLVGPRLRPAVVHIEARHAEMVVDVLLGMEDDAELARGIGVVGDEGSRPRPPFSLTLSHVFLAHLEHDLHCERAHAAAMASIAHAEHGTLACAFSSAAAIQEERVGIHLALLLGRIMKRAGRSRKVLDRCGTNRRWTRTLGELLDRSRHVEHPRHGTRERFRGHLGPPWRCWRGCCCSSRNSGWNEGFPAHPSLHLRDAPRTSLAILGASRDGDVKEILDLFLPF